MTLIIEPLVIPYKSNSKIPNCVLIVIFHILLMYFCKTTLDTFSLSLTCVGCLCGLSILFYYFFSNFIRLLFHIKKIIFKVIYSILI